MNNCASLQENIYAMKCIIYSSMWFNIMLSVYLLSTASFITRCTLTSDVLLNHLGLQSYDVRLWKLSLAHPCLFDNTSRSYYYATSQSMRDVIPVLMDSFAYYEGDSLVIEAIFNLRYLKVSNEEKRRIQRSLCVARLGNKFANNSMEPDPHGHTILTVFNFGSALWQSSLNVTILHVYTNESYSIRPSIIPNFTKERYYLSSCTSIDTVPLDRVRMWLYWNYLQGVEHTTIFANARYDYWKATLNPFLKNGVLEVVDMEFPKHEFLKEQQLALQSCNRHYRFASKFVIFNDIDEFFIPIDVERTVRSLVSHYDQCYPDAVAFSV